MSIFPPEESVTSIVKPETAAVEMGLVNPDIVKPIRVGDIKLPNAPVTVRT